MFGNSAGISPLAITIAAAFWTSIWGSPSLLLLTPITACLAVLVRHVCNLNFIEPLSGDKPALSAVQRFYQRVLVSDVDKVVDHVEVLLKNKSLFEYY